MGIEIVHCKKEKYDVYIGRPSKFGNPFTIGKDGTREEVIAKFAKYFYGNSELKALACKELSGKRLGCWCAPHKCHGDIIKAYLEGSDICDGY